MRFNFNAFMVLNKLSVPETKYRNHDYLTLTLPVCLRNYQLTKSLCYYDTYAYTGCLHPNTHLQEAFLTDCKEIEANLPRLTRGAMLKCNLSF